MKLYIYLFFTFIVLSSCKNDVEITKTDLFVKGGIENGLTILNYKNSYLKTPTKTEYIKERVSIHINNDNITTKYTNGDVEYYKNGIPFELTKMISLTSKNENYYWTYENSKDTIKYDICPIKLKNNKWYMLSNFSNYGKKSYVHFHINENGEIEQGDIEYVNVSPI